MLIGSLLFLVSASILFSKGGSGMQALFPAAIGLPFGLAGLLSILQNVRTPPGQIAGFAVKTLPPPLPPPLPPIPALPIDPPPGMTDPPGS